MNQVMKNYLSDCAQSCESLRLQIASIDAGSRTGGRHWPQREVYDDTAEWRQTLQAYLADYERLIAQYSPAA